MYTRIEIHPSLNPFRCGGNCAVFRHVSAGCLNCFALGCIANMGIVFEHLAIEMAGDAHDGLIARFAFGEPRNRAMPQIVKTQTRESGHRFLLFRIR